MSCSNALWGLTDTCPKHCWDCLLGPFLKSRSCVSVVESLQYCGRMALVYVTLIGACKVLYGMRSVCVRQDHKQGRTCSALLTGWAGPGTEATAAFPGAGAPWGLGDLQESTLSFCWASPPWGHCRLVWESPFIVALTKRKHNCFFPVSLNSPYRAKFNK